MVAKASAVSTHRTAQSLDPVNVSPRDYLTEREMELLCKAAKHGRHGARDAIADVIEGSHSLHNYPAQRVPLAYERARRDATDDTGLPLVTFPEACSWPVVQVLDEDFWPEA